MKRLMWLRRWALCLVTSVVVGCGGGGGKDEAPLPPGMAQAGDTTPPTLTSVFPANNALGVGTNSALSATFSEPLGVPSGTPFTLCPTAAAPCPPGAVVAGSISVAGSTATFTPAASLAATTQFTATITTAVRDLAGNMLAVPFTWVFMTGGGPDIIPPTVSATSPANNATGVVLSTTITATFSEAMTNASLDTSSFTVVRTIAGTPIAGTVTVAGNTAIFTPTGALPPTTQITATITTAALDAAGNALAAPFVWQFTTGAAPDTTPPVVSFTAPANGQTGVGTTTSVSSVTFSEAMDNSTINSSTFQMVDSNGAPVTAVLTISGNSATLTPIAPLLPGTDYSTTVTTGVRDASGNALAAPYTWTFTTGPAPDTTPPTVTMTNPTNGALGVASNAAISATFSEAMTNASINTASFTLFNNTTPGNVIGTVSIAGNTASFVPQTPLAFSSNFTATISTAVGDAAGTPMAAPFVFSFTTGLAPDTNAPTVVLPTSPANAASGVAQNATVSATFSEPMQNSTLNTSSFTVAPVLGGPNIPGTVFVTGNTVTFTPLASLPESTALRATITTAATDAAGNPLAMAETWTFGTAGSPPTVIASSIADNATNVSLNSTLTITFSEPMNNGTLILANFQVRDPTLALVPGTVSFIGNTMTFTPSAPLAASTTFTATVTTGVTDVAGNALAVNFVITFTTGTGAFSACPTTASNVSAAGGITLNLAAHRSTGVAPLAVSFDASGSTHSNGGIKPYHDVEYSWDFDFNNIGAGGTWGFGSRAGLSSKKLAKGTIAAHLFELPGAYRVRLSAFDGTSTATFDCEIVVAPASTLGTLCVSNTADFTGCPVACPSANCLANTNNFTAAINTTAGNGNLFKRILFKGGDTFTAAAGSARITVNGPGLVGSFGTGKANITATGGPAPTILVGNNTVAAAGFGDWRIMDLSFSGFASLGSAVAHNGTSNGLTIFRNDIVGAQISISAQLNTLDFINTPTKIHNLYNALAIIENVITNSNDYAFFGAAERFMVIGNRFNNAVTQHGMRMQYGQRVVISNNELGVADKTSMTLRSVVFRLAGRTGINIVGAQTIPDQAVFEFGVVSDNKVIGRSGTLPFSISHQDGRHRKFLVERNWIMMAAGGPGAPGALMQIEAGDTSIRNNLYDVTESAATQQALSLNLTGSSPALDGIYYYNNSIFSNKAAGFPLFMISASAGAPTNVAVRNNLAYAPQQTPGSATTTPNGTFGAGLVVSNNSIQAEIQTTGVFAVTPPVNPIDWTPSGPNGGPANDSGAIVPVFSDFFTTSRPSAGPYDRGAIHVP